MKVELVRHSFPDRPDWILINETVPLGTRYEVLGYDSRYTIENLLFHEKRNIEVYLLRENGHEGWLPKVCFEPVKVASYQTIENPWGI
jgi:hypothetical protein